MANYIDGFAFPVPRDRLDNYKRVVEVAVEVWKDHGALSYQEYVGDDLNLEGTSSFVNLLGAHEDKVILFGWVAFESKEARDSANEKVASDPRMAEIMTSVDSGFDPSRMAYGGFRLFV